MLRMIFVLTIIIFGAAASTIGAFQGLLFYLWNAYFRPESWVYSDFIGQLRLSLIIGAYVVIRTFISLPNLQINRQTILLFLFFIQAFIGTLASEEPVRSWAFFDQFSKVLLISYMIVVLVTDRHRFRLVFLVIALSLGFETAKQGWADLVRYPGRVNPNPVPFLGDNNGVALGLLMLAPIFGALIQTSKPTWERAMHRFVGAGVVIRAISTYSRGAFVGAIALVGMTIFRSHRRVRGLVAAGIVGTIIWSVMPQAFWDRMDTITVEEGDERDASAEGRIYFWGIGVEMANANPMTGVGLNAFVNAFPRYNTDERFEGQRRAAHSIWFGVLGDLGYPGLVLFVANLAAAFWSCWRVQRMARGRPEYKALSIYANALINALVVYAVTGSFLSHHYNEMAWHLVALSAALYVIAVRETRQVDGEELKAA